MVKNFCLFLSMLFLLGCLGKPRTIVEYKEVKVPVYIFPKIDIPEKPQLEIEILPDNPEIGQLSQAWVITAEQLQQYIEKLLKIIEEHNKLVDDRSAVL